MQRLLLVEDDSEKLKRMERLAKRPDRDIVLAENRAKAIGILEKQHIDLVVTDLALQGPGQDTDGLDVLRAAKNKDKNLPVILISSYLTTPVNERARSGGAFVVIDRATMEEPYKWLEIKIDLALQTRQALLDASAINSPHGADKQA